MKRLLALSALLIPMYLFAQGFGSFSHDQPFLASSNQSSAVPSLLPNLFEYWKLDYSSGAASFPGSVGITNMATSGTGVATNQTGIISNSIHFSGSSSGIIYNQHSIMDSKSNSFSVTLWFYNGGPVDESSGQTLVGRWDPGGSNFKWTVFYSSSPDGLNFYWQNGAGTLANDTLFPRGVMTNQWVFLSVGWDSATSKTWWSTNGAAAHENTMLYGFSSSPLAFEIGNVNSGSQGLVAYVDEVGYWTNRLSNSDISYLYNSGVGRSYPFSP